MRTWLQFVLIQLWEMKTTQPHRTRVCSWSCRACQFVASYSLSQFTSFLPLSFDPLSKALKSADSDTTVIFLVLLTLIIIYTQMVEFVLAPSQTNTFTYFPNFLQAWRYSKIKNTITTCLPQIAVKFSVNLEAWQGFSSSAKLAGLALSV